MNALRLGLIGSGNIAGAHLKAAPHVPQWAQFVAIASPHEANRQRQSARFNIARSYADPAELLAAPDIEGVVICTPHDTHAELARRCCAAGKHVLVEKPMACSLAECDAMIAAAQAAGTTLMVAQCQRFDPAYRGLKRILDAGELGPVRAVRIDAMQNAAAFVPPDHWYLDARRAGGGIVISVAIHKLDLVRYLIGDVVRVTAACRTISPLFRHGAEDYAVATLEFANGAVGQLFATWSAFRLPYSENLMIFGDDGAVHALPPGETQMGPALVASRQRTPPAVPGFAGQFGGFTPVESDGTGLPAADPFANQLAHFVECCRTGAEPLSGGNDNRKTMAVVFAIYESAHTGLPAPVKILP
ncbi:MAG: Gfo/Idh/MocA family oxidoreductase [bacterium]